VTWRLLQTGARHAAENMAIDELLLEEISRLGHPLLRFYGWLEPAATFGYFQQFKVVETRTALRPLIRRPTGGGLVPHDADWTYSMIFPPSDAWWSLSARESYERLHRWLSAAFERVHVPTSLAPERRSGPPLECFVAPEQHDLLLGTQKLAGAAQRRNRRGLLIQGSVQPPQPGPAKADWQMALCEAARQLWGVEWQAWELSPEQEARVTKLAQTKYSQPSYNQKR
jgi:lipoate-protein ligase A